MSSVNASPNPISGVELGPLSYLNRNAILGISKHPYSPPQSNTDYTLIIFWHLFQLLEPLLGCRLQFATQNLPPFVPPENPKNYQFDMSTQSSHKSFICSTPRALSYQVSPLLSFRAGMLRMEGFQTAAAALRLELLGGACNRSKGQEQL